MLIAKDVRPMHNFELTLVSLDKGGETLNPIPIIAIEQVINHADLSFVDMPADHSLAIT
jgi:hypothetical protein